MDSDFVTERHFDPIIALETEGKKVRALGSELDLRFFEQRTVENHVTSIIRELSASPSLQRKFGLRGFIQFENHANMLDPDLSSPLNQSSVPRLHRPRADQFCVYNTSSESTSVESRVAGYIIEYKAPHKVSLGRIWEGLDEMELAEVIVKRDPEGSRDSSRRLIAAVLSQTFSYMIYAGLGYGYVCTGEAFIFMYIPDDDPTTLLYSLSVPNQDVGETTGWDPTNDQAVNRLHLTAVGQVLAFTLQALKAPPRGPLWRQEAAAKLPRWEVVLEDLIDELPPTCETPSSAYKPSRHPTDLRSSPIRLRQRPRPSSSSSCHNPQHGDSRSDDDNPDTPSRPPRGMHGVPAPQPQPSSARTSAVKGSSTGHEGRRNTGQHRRQYCTHQCLRGLVTGDPLDPKCPNMAEHGQDFRHPIDRQTFIQRLHTQLAHDLDHDMVNLGIWGSRGALFQVTLTEYGYTFIGKGTTAHHMRHLQTEARIYDRLQPIQGMYVPVCVGSIDLKWHYPYEGVVDLVHMICLSFAGRPIIKCLNDNNKAELVQQARHAIQAIHQLGVLHRDAEPRNLLWDAIAGQVMVVDFERAEIVQIRPVLAKLSPPNRKRKYEEEGHGHDIMVKGGFVFTNELDNVTMYLQ